MLHPVICIDGPAASGKSTVARLVAHDLNFVYVDTGAMYRAFTFLTLEAGHDPTSRARIKQLLEKVDFHADIRDGEIALCEGKRDLTPHIRLPEINAAVSHVSTLPELREYLVNLQRKLRLIAPLVMEGRDIGTVVCSDSPFKYFIDACPTVRAERRRKQGQEDNLAARDKIDSSRSAAPLVRAADATLLDSGKHDARALADRIITEVRSRLQPGPSLP
ncbi:MAG: (d)CMP kinase [Verrucomicrobia bacterium]|nr:(d)CMP kinase [Verrucomicrobiota bacterium]